MAVECYYFELLSGTIVAFIGNFGTGGVLVYRASENDWQFHATGSTTWSDFHQGVFRNSRADSISEDELKHRGIHIPAINEYADRPAMAWADNFQCETPLDTVPPSMVEAVSNGPGIVYLVLEEDKYETSFGDGKFLYPVAAFWSDAEAIAFSKAHESKWSEHIVRRVCLKIDSTNNRLRSTTEIQQYEHIDLPNVLKLLEK